MSEKRVTVKTVCIPPQYARIVSTWRRLSIMIVVAFCGLTGCISFNGNSALQREKAFRTKAEEPLKRMNNIADDGWFVAEWVNTGNAPDCFNDILDIAKRSKNVNIQGELLAVVLGKLQSINNKLCVSQLSEKWIVTAKKMANDWKTIASDDVVAVAQEYGKKNNIAFGQYLEAVSK